MLRGKTRRALDSTVLDDAVATRDTVTQLIGAIRRLRREAPVTQVESRCAAEFWAGGFEPLTPPGSHPALLLLGDALRGCDVASQAARIATHTLRARRRSPVAR